MTPLRDQSASQIEADRARCNEWAKGTAVVSAGYAACMISAGYEAPPGVRSTSQSVRLARAPTPNDPIGILIDFLECDREAQREAESELGTVGKAIRDYVGWAANADKRQHREELNRVPGCLRNSRDQERAETRTYMSM